MAIKVRKLKNGERRYDVRLRNPSDPAKEDSRTFRTRKEAEAYEAQQRADRSRGLGIDPRRSSVTVSKWADQWLEQNPGKRGSTRARDESILDNHIRPAIGSRTLGAVRQPDVQKLVSRWAESYAPSTVDRMYGVVRAIFRAAVDADYLGRTPCRAIKLPEKETQKRHIVSADELAALAGALPEGLALMPFMGAVLGLRWGEVAGLRVGSIDFLQGTLRVEVQRTRGKGGAMVEGPPKSQAGRRTLSVPAALLDLLSAHLTRRGLTGADATAYVFVDRDGQPLDYSNWRRRVWLPALRTAGLKGLRFHDLRRANATSMVAEGVDVKTAQGRLGHSDIRLTLETYAQATTEADRAAADRVGDHFMGGALQRKDATG